MRLSTLKWIAFTQRYYWVVAALLFGFEVVANYQIIQRIPYTEIDWKAYMQEVIGVIDGERNYLKLKGDTGPLVYPAGFVWIYQVLYYITDSGTDLRRAQYVFMGLYLATLAIVFGIYRRAHLPPIMLPLLVLSKRVHSIYVLRLFNDPFAILFAYLGIYALTSRSKTFSHLSSVLFSLGIAVKMNVQLMLPGIAYIWWRQGGLRRVCAQLAVVTAVQILLALPFLTKFPNEYLARAFDFGRQFDFTWTVNWRFIGKEMFLSQGWSMALIVAHLSLLLMFGLAIWPRLSASTAWVIIKEGFGAARRITCQPSASEIVTVIFTANFAGIVCARSLHYQFYSWYFHMLPYLLHISNLNLAIQAVLWLCIEYSWNVYPSTTVSSLILLTAHISLLVATMYRIATFRAPAKAKHS
ncbi:dolichyl-P-Man:Man(5)GlcNAc(2)-PP-dolichol alpha-1,3-mannosyltransferase [Coemansia sp. RSA 2607]|nr:dolichyl-P-Man:Man(5)GlcNAc(2)-PP-dolichol alpha-1,3-mannosyltransferase [Coemansia sp. RSA 2607]